jgi:hypothetical protein
MKRVAAWTILLLTVALLPFASNTAQAAVSTGVGVTSNGLVMYFDPANPNAYNSSKLRDLSGNGYDATFYKTGAWPAEETSRGKYLGFDGGGGYLDLADNLSGVGWTNGLTITFYANFGGGAGNFERIMDFGNSFEADNIIVGRHGTSSAIFAEVFEGNAGGQCASDSGAIGNATWDFWTVTFDGSNCKIYKNNSIIKTLANTKKPRSGVVRNNAYIGKSNWSDAAFEGGISDLAIYNRVITGSEMTQNYNASTDYTVPTVSGGANAANENQDLATNIFFDQFGSSLSIIGGNDSDKVSISSSGYVSFIANPNYPNYENPTDYGADRRYDFVVRVIDPSGNYTDYTTYVTISNLNENATLSTPSLSSTPNKGVPVTITVTPGGDTPIPPGRVTYLIAGKRIPGCYKKVYTGTGNSTCSWKPAVQGYREITVTFTPTSNTYSAATSKRTFLIFKRTTNR